MLPIQYIRGCLPRNLYLSLLECSPCLAFSYHQLVNVKIAPPDPPTRPSPMEESVVNRSPTAPVPISPFCWSAVLAWPWPSFMSTLQKLRVIVIQYHTVPYFRICLTVAFCRISNFENQFINEKVTVYDIKVLKIIGFCVGIYPKRSSFCDPRYKWARS